MGQCDFVGIGWPAILQPFSCPYFEAVAHTLLQLTPHAELFTKGLSEDGWVGGHIRSMRPAWAVPLMLYEALAVEWHSTGGAHSVYVVLVGSVLQ